MTRRYLPAGTDALLVELTDLAHTLDLLAALQAAEPAAVYAARPAKKVANKAAKNAALKTSSRK